MMFRLVTLRLFHGLGLNPFLVSLALVDLVRRAGRRDKVDLRILAAINTLGLVAFVLLVSGRGQVDLLLLRAYFILGD